MFAKTQCECKKRRIVLMTAKHSATVYSCDRPQQFIEIRKQCHKTLRTPNCVQKCCRRNFSSKTSELRTNDWLNVYAEPCRIVNHCETTAVTRAVLCLKGLAMQSQTWFHVHVNWNGFLHSRLVLCVSSLLPWLPCHMWALFQIFRTPPQKGWVFNLPLLQISFGIQWQSIQRFFLKSYHFKSHWILIHA